MRNGKGPLPMQRRRLGNTDIEVSEIAFGAWQLGNADDWDTMEDPTAHRLIAAAIDAGVNLFDTAPNYASTRSEVLLGDALAGKRHDVVLVSKFGHRPEGPKDFSVDWFWPSLEASLKRLRTDYLDVYLLHSPDAALYQGTDPIWNALEEARTQGKIRYYGASLDLADEIEACLANTRSHVIEILFNIFHQDARRAFQTVRSQGTGTIVKVPLDSGWLTGRFDANSHFTGVRSRWRPDQIARRASLVDELTWLTADGAPLARKALGFLLAYDEVSCVIPGMRTLKQLKENLSAAGHSVSPSERQRLEDFWDGFTRSGLHLLPW